MIELFNRVKAIVLEELRHFSEIFRIYKNAAIDGYEILTIARNPRGEYLAYVSGKKPVALCSKAVRATGNCYWVAYSLSAA